MTRACFYRRGGSLMGFALSGHAGYAQAGSDILCSALSVATHMTALGVIEILGLNALVKTDEAHGRMLLIVDAADAERAQPMLRTLEREILEISHQYPEFVRIIYRERREFKCFS